MKFPSLILCLCLLLQTATSQYFAPPPPPPVRYCVPKYVEKKYILHKPGKIKKIPVIKEIVKKVYVPIKVPVKVFVPTPVQATYVSPSPPPTHPPPPSRDDPRPSGVPEPEKTAHHIYFHHHYHPGESGVEKSGPVRRALPDYLALPDTTFEGMTHLKRKPAFWYSDEPRNLGFEDTGMRELLSAVYPMESQAKSSFYSVDPDDPEVPEPGDPGFPRNTQTRARKIKFKSKQTRKSKSSKRKSRKLKSHQSESYGDLDSLMESAELPSDQEAAGLGSLGSAAAEEGPDSETESADLRDILSQLPSRFSRVRNRQPFNLDQFLGSGPVPGAEGGAYSSAFEARLLKFILENTNLVSSLVSKQNLAKCMLQCANNLAQSSPIESGPKAFQLTPGDLGSIQQSQQAVPYYTQNAPPPGTQLQSHPSVIQGAVESSPPRAPVYLSNSPSDPRPVATPIETHHYHHQPTYHLIKGQQDPPVPNLPPPSQQPQQPAHHTQIIIQQPPLQPTNSRPDTQPSPGSFPNHPHRPQLPPPQPFEEEPQEDPNLDPSISSMLYSDDPRTSTRERPSLGPEAASNKKLYVFMPPPHGATNTHAIPEPQARPLVSNVTQYHYYSPTYPQTSVTPPPRPSDPLPDILLGPMVPSTIPARYLSSASHTQGRRLEMTPSSPFTGHQAPARARGEVASLSGSAGITGGTAFAGSGSSIWNPIFGSPKPKTGSTSLLPSGLRTSMKKLFDFPGAGKSSKEIRNRI